MGITAKEIQEQGFEHSRKGYDVDEVDVFLEHVAVEVDNLNREIADLRARLEGRAGWEVLGPADCLKARAKDRVRRHLMVKAPVGEQLGVVLGAAARSLGTRPGISVAVDVDCHDLM
jgi:DivIVA domain-containing protein